MTGHRPVATASLVAILRRTDPQTHRNHRRLDKAVFFEKCLRHIFRPVRQQRDTNEVLLPREVYGVFEELFAIAFTLTLLMNHQVLQQHYETAFGGADG